MNRLGKILKNKHCTEEQLANLLGIVPEIVFDWECGRRPLDEEYLQAICEYFDVRSEYLLGHRMEATVPVSQWPKDLQDDYYGAPPEFREHMLRIYGKPNYYEENEPPEKGELVDAFFECRGKRIKLRLTQDSIEHIENYIKQFQN